MTQTVLHFAVSFKNISVDCFILVRIELIHFFPHLCSILLHGCTFINQIPIDEYLGCHNLLLFQTVFC